MGRWRFVTLCTHSVDSSRDVADLDINLDLMPDKERTVVRLALSGSLTVTDKATLDACLDKYERLFAAPWPVGAGRPRSRSIPADGEFDDLGIGGSRRGRCRRTGRPPRGPTARTPTTPGRRSAAAASASTGAMSRLRPESKSKGR